MLEQRIGSIGEKNAKNQGYWGIEHNTGQHEYARVAVQVDKVREVLARW
jgi:hypothetical protein